VVVEECTVALPSGGAFGAMFHYKKYVQEIILHELFDVKYYLMEIKNKSILPIYHSFTLYKSDSWISNLS
jgi:hypothetical protein